MSNEIQTQNVVNTFIEKVVGISIPTGMVLVRKQYRKSTPEVLVFLMQTRKCYFNLKQQYPNADTELLSLIASISVAVASEGQVAKPKKMLVRKQAKKDFLLDRSALVCEWLDSGCSYRHISKHLLTHYRKDISATYVHRIARELNWNKGDNLENCSS